MSLLAEHHALLCDELRVHLERAGLLGEGRARQVVEELAALGAEWEKALTKQTELLNEALDALDKDDD